MDWCSHLEILDFKQRLLDFLGPRPATKKLPGCYVWILCPREAYDQIPDAIPVTSSPFGQLKLAYAFVGALGLLGLVYPFVEVV